MPSDKPDPFFNVHKGIRKALFDMCHRIGTHEEREPVSEALKQTVHEVLRFVTSHGENEDLFLVSSLKERDPGCAKRITEAHRSLDLAILSLQKATEKDARTLYFEACSFTARYLEHMREEELEHLLVIHAQFSADELAAFGKNAMARIPPTDQAMMLRYMFGAMSEGDVATFLANMRAKMPSEAFVHLKCIADGEASLRRGATPPSVSP